MNIEILNWLQPPWEGDEGRVKRTGRDEPVGVVIHICMETTQGVCLCSYLYLKLTKTSCFSNYVLCFFFYKIGEQEGGTGSARVGGIGTSGMGRWQRKGQEDEYCENNVYICM
jgi:hypothetical protein